MSLTSFIRQKEVAERLRPFRPPVRAADAKLKVPPTSGRPQLVGTAFDYLLRFDLQRLCPHAVAGEWVAELVPRLIRPAEMAERVAAVCRSAREAHGEYLLDPAPTDAHRRALAAWAVRLAKLDGVYRRGEFDPSFADAPAPLVDELVALLKVVPFPLLTHPESLQLNPHFGAASALVGGADADLIAGDRLIDVKTTKSAEVKGDALDQLFGYFLLARRAGLPPIRQVGLYFSRFAQLRRGETTFWTERPGFADTERWFFERARECFPPAGLAAAAVPPPEG